jgi:tetratricopeptide (TPR) repeat protein
MAERRVAGWSKRRDCAGTVWSALAALLSVVMLLGVGHGVWAADELTPEQQRLLKEARTLSQQAVALYQRGQYPQATQLLREAVRLCEQAYPKDKYPQGHPDLARSLNNLGFLLKAQGDYGKALDCYQRALTMRESLYPKDKYPQGHPHLAYSLNNLGFLLEAQGDYVKALDYFRRALTMRESLYPRDKYPQGHLDLATSLNSLGGLLYAQGEYSKAVDYLQRALTMLESLYPKDKYPQGHPHLATSLNNLGGLLWAQGDYGKAVDYLQRALTMRESLYPRDKYPQGHPELAENLNNLGLLPVAQEDYGKALDYFQRALTMRESLYSKDKYPQGHHELAESLNNLGGLLKAQGDYGKAVDYYRRALTMYKSLYPKDKYPQGHPELARSLNNLGSLLEAQGDYGKALDYHQRTLAMDEGLNDIFLASASEAEGLNYLAKRPLTRDGYLSIARHLPDTAEASYTHVWRGKAALAKLLERRQQALMLANPKVRQRGDKLTATRHQLASLLLTPPGRYKDHAERLEKLADQKEELERQLARQLPAFAQLQQLDRLTHRDLLAKLPDRSVFVDLLRYTFFEQDPKRPGLKGEKRTLCYVAFVLRRGHPLRWVELGEAAPIDKALTEWRQELAAWKPGRPEEKGPAATLRQLVWEPLVQHIPADTETVFLAPDSHLTALPWAALPGRQRGRVLLEDHAVAVVPHGRLLLEQLLAKAAADPEQGLVLAAGAVQYDREPAPVQPAQTLLALDRGAERGSKKLSWPYLYGSRAELEQVRVLAGKREVWPRQGTEASTAQLLRDLPEARWAHLATHGFFADPRFRSVLQVGEKDFARLMTTSGEVRDRIGAGARNPLVLSGVVLAGANLDQPDSGILTAEAIAGLPLRKLELAVLSACETGLGETAGGEGVFGLQRAFHVAGTRTVIATLWKVDDQATAALMSLFFAAPTWSVRSDDRAKRPSQGPNPAIAPR